MATMIVTKDRGGAGRSEDMTVVPPGRDVPLSTLQAIGKYAEVDGIVLADAISAMTMHVRAAARFARSAAEQSQVGELRKIHLALLQIYTQHVATLEALLDKFELPRAYVSPAGRMAAFLAQSVMQAPLLAGSVRPETMEFTLLEVALGLAEKTLADRHALAAITAAAKPSNTAAVLAKAVKALGVGAATLEGLRAIRSQCLVAIATAKTP